MSIIPDLHIYDTCFYSPALVIYRLLGQRNLVYLLCMLALWWVTGSYEVFLVCTSYVHYFR